MIRVLHCVNDMKRAGLETMIMNYYRKIDRNLIQFDFLTHRENPGEYEEEIKELGGKIYRAPRLYPKNYPAYFKFMRTFFKEHPEYEIVHSHIDSMSYLPLLASKKSNVPYRISHSHSDSIEKDYKYLLKELFRFLLPGVANRYMACSDVAAKYLFGNRKVTIIPNAVDAEKFIFNESIRNNIRKQFNIEDKFVIGHVGRMDDVKNHKYLVKVFNEICKINKDSILMLVGCGKNYDSLVKQAQELNIIDKILFLGSREDVNDLYQAMDLLIFPSKFEGFGIVPIEAQFSGLPCLLSDVLPKEVCFTNNCKFLDINNNEEIWAKEAIKTFNENVNRNIEIKNDIYDINKSYALLQNYYLKLVKENK